MKISHWYGIAILGGAVLGFFVVAKNDSKTVDSIYNSGWNTAVSF